MTENTVFGAKFVEVRCLKPISKAINDSTSFVSLEMGESEMLCSYPSKSGKISTYLRIDGTALPSYYLKGGVPITKTVLSKSFYDCICKTGLTSSMSVDLDEDSVGFGVEVCGNNNVESGHIVDIVTNEGYKCADVSHEFPSYPDNPAIKVINKKLKEIRDSASTNVVTHANICLSSLGKMDVTLYSGTKDLPNGKKMGDKVISMISYSDEIRPKNYAYDNAVAPVPKSVDELFKDQIEAVTCDLFITDKECDIFHMLFNIAPHEFMVAFYISEAKDKILISSLLGSFGTIDIVVE